MLMWGEGGAATKVVMEARGKEGVELHYVVEIGGATPDLHCPPKYKVTHHDRKTVCCGEFLANLGFLWQNHLCKIKEITNSTANYINVINDSVSITTKCCIRYPKSNCLRSFYSII